MLLNGGLGVPFGADLQDNRDDLLRDFLRNSFGGAPSRIPRGERHALIKHDGGKCPKDDYHYYPLKWLRDFPRIVTFFFHFSNVLKLE